MEGDKHRLLTLALMLPIGFVTGVLLAECTREAGSEAYLWFLLAYAIGVVCHETGHLLLALLGSIPVRLISIGAGPVVLRGRIGETTLELRLLPLSGFVFHYPLLQYRRFRHVLFLLGGVVANAMVIGVVMALDAFGALSQQARSTLMAVVLAQLVLIIVSLLPLRARFAGIPIGTDGLQLLQILRGTHPAAHAGLAYNSLLGAYSTSGQVDPTVASSRVLYHSGRVDRWTDAKARYDTHEALLRELARRNLPREAEILVLDTLVTDGLVFGDAHLRSRLDEWSARALELGPEVNTLRGSRGAVLVELGRYEEGKALLKSVLVADKTEGLDASVDTLMTQVFLARAELKLGNTAAAQLLAAEARARAEAFTDSPMKAPLCTLAETALRYVSRVRAEARPT